MEGLLAAGLVEAFGNVFLLNGDLDSDLDQVRHDGGHVVPVRSKTSQRLKAADRARRKGAIAPLILGGCVGHAVNLEHPGRIRKGAK